MITLGMNERASHQVTDHELVASAYQRWKNESPRHLLGDFAFAIWDPKDQSLFLARDPLGIKPLYYFWNGKKLIFGTRITPFFEDPSVPKRQNETTIADYLLGEFRDHGATFFQEIKQLPPAHSLHLSKEGEIRLRRYWKPDPGRQIHYAFHEDYLEHYREIFLSAMKDRLRSAHPIGFLLSGGLDSTHIMAAAEALRSRSRGYPPFEAATLTESGFWQEEWDALESLKATYGTKIEMIGLSDFQSGFELNLDQGETPHPEGLPIIPPLLERLQSKGCQVCLTGFGASEFFNGSEYGYLEDVFLGLQIPKLMRELKKVSHATNSSVKANLAWLAFEAIREVLPKSLRQWIKSLTFGHSPIRKALLLPCRTESLVVPSSFPSRCRELAYRAIARPSFAFALNQIDEASERYSMEMRHPFLDLRLIEFFLAIPDAVKMKDGYRKMFVQQSLKEMVPGRLRQREGEDLLNTGTRREIFRKFQADRLRTYLSKPNSPIFRYVDHSVILSMISSDIRNFSHYNLFLWRLPVLGHWLQRFFPDSEIQKEVPDERYSSCLST